MIFLDCGAYVGRALQRYQDEGVVDDTWIIYSFEPNPRIKGKNLIRKAVWIEDGTVLFQISGREDSGSVEGTAGHADPEKIMVESFNFSKFVDNLPDEFIICSMDIEGAEFPVLDKMLKEHTINGIDLLDIEFHHRLVEDKTAADAERLIKQITERGVKVRLKVPIQ